MPYHFGGWSNCGGAGWMWMPGENGFWNPGAVLWYGNGGNVGWAPAPPSGPKHPRHPRVNPPHPAAVAVVMATKNLTKEGRYEVKSSARVTSSLHEFSSPPLADGKMPIGETALANRGGETADGTKVLVPTAENLASLRALLGGTLPSPVGHMPTNSAPPADATQPSGATGSLPATGLVNAAAPPARIPSPPPARSYAFAPSQPGQASARASSSTSSSGSGLVSSGGSRGGSSSSSSGTSSSAGSSSRGSGGNSAGGGTASASGGGGGGRPH